MTKTLIRLLLEFIAGLAGNLLAGWIQQDVWTNIFTSPRITGTIICAGLMILVLAWLDSGRQFLWIKAKKNDQQPFIRETDAITHTHRSKVRRERALDGLLKNVQSTWIDGYLTKALDTTIFLRLNFSYEPKGVTRTMVYAPYRDEQEHEALSTPRSILKLFENCGHNLLILGEPGTGKSITLLQLTKGLIQKALDDPEASVPVYLNLSSWSVKRLSLADWVVEEMLLQYQTARNANRIWLRHNQLILLLDGLDEVTREYQDECIRAINSFKAEFSVDVVVCSRKADYENLRERLNLSTAICLQPLAESEVARYLNQKKLKLQTVQAVLQTDPVLRELSKFGMVP